MTIKRQLRIKILELTLLNYVTMEKKIIIHNICVFYGYVRKTNTVLNAA